MNNIKVFWQIFRINIKKSLIYRANFLVTVISITLWMGLYILFFEVIFSHVDSLAGWSKGEALTLLGFFYFVQGISNVFFRESFETFDFKLRKGQLDQVITKPASAQLLSFFVDMRIDHFLDLLITAMIFLYVQFQTDLVLSLPLMAYGLVLSLLGTLLFYGIMLSLITLVFLFDRIDVISSTIWNVSQVSRYPRAIYTSHAATVLQFLFPAALIAAIPAEVAVGSGESYWIFMLIFLSFIFFGIGTMLFHVGLRKYSSAN
jgi:ABC-2 type transport system permease protein